ETARPSLIQVRSHIAYPAPNARDTAKAHGAPLGEDEVRATKERMGLDPERRFYVPEDVARHMSLVADGRRFEREWTERFSRWRAGCTGHGEVWDLAWAGAPAPGWAAALPTFDAAAAGKLATRAAGGKVMKAFQRFTPTMIGGAADLAESTKTVFEGAGQFAR